MTGRPDRSLPPPVRFGLSAGSSRIDLPALVAELERILAPRPERRQAGTILVDGVRRFFKWERAPRWRLARVGRASLARRACRTWEALAATPAPPRVPAHIGWWERRRFGAAASWGVLTAWVDGARPLSRDCPAGTDPGALLSEVGDQVGRLHRAGFAACSIDANNLLVRGLPERPEAWLVDLEHAVPRLRRPGGAAADLADAVALLGRRLSLDRPEAFAGFFSAYGRSAGRIVAPAAAERIVSAATAVVPGRAPAGAPGGAAKPAFPPPRLEPVPGASFPVERIVRNLPPAASPE